MAKKHQYKISSKSTRSKASRSWRRKAKTGLKKDKTFEKLPKLRKIPKSGIPKESKISNKPIGRIVDIVDPAIMERLKDL